MKKNLIRGIVFLLLAGFVVSLFLYATPFAYAAEIEDGDYDEYDEDDGEVDPLTVIKERVTIVLSARVDPRGTGDVHVTLSNLTYGGDFTFILYEFNGYSTIERVPPGDYIISSGGFYSDYMFKYSVENLKFSLTKANTTIYFDIGDPDYVEASPEPTYEATEEPTSTEPPNISISDTPHEHVDDSGLIKQREDVEPPPNYFKIIMISAIALASLSAIIIAFIVWKKRCK